MTITNIEMATTSTGKPYKKVTLDQQVLGKDRFNIFSFHTRYEDVQVGRAFTPADFEQDGQYIKMKDPDAGVKKFGGAGGGRNNLNIAIAQERKTESIAKSFDRKEDGIKTSSTFRDATLLTVEMMKEDKLLDWHVAWQENRQWLIDHYEIEKLDNEVIY